MFEKGDHEKEHSLGIFQNIQECAVGYIQKQLYKFKDLTLQSESETLLCCILKAEKSVLIHIHSDKVQRAEY